MLKRMVWIVSLLSSLGCVPAWGLVDCWEGRDAAALAMQSDVVLIGFITRVDPLGCLLADGTTRACPTDLVTTGAGVPDRVEKVQFTVRRVLKGHAAKSVEFLVVVPEATVANCRGPGVELFTHSLAFL